MGHRVQELLNHRLQELLGTAYRSCWTQPKKRTCKAELTGAFELLDTAYASCWDTAYRSCRGHSSQEPLDIAYRRCLTQLTGAVVHSHSPKKEVIRQSSQEPLSCWDTAYRGCGTQFTGAVGHNLHEMFDATNRSCWTQLTGAVGHSLQKLLGHS